MKQLLNQRILLYHPLKIYPFIINRNNFIAIKQRKF